MHDLTGEGGDFIFNKTNLFCSYSPSHTHIQYQNVRARVICPASRQEAMYMHVYVVSGCPCNNLGDKAHLLSSPSHIWVPLMLVVMCWLQIHLFVPIRNCQFLCHHLHLQQDCSLPFVSQSWWDAAGRCALGSCRSSAHADLTVLHLNFPQCFHTQTFSGLTFL